MVAFHHLKMETAWWFGTFINFPCHIWDVILPIDFHSIIFQDGKETTNQEKWDLVANRGQLQDNSSAKLGWYPLVN